MSNRLQSDEIAPFWFGRVILELGLGQAWGRPVFRTGRGTAVGEVYAEGCICFTSAHGTYRSRKKITCYLTIRLVSSILGVLGCTDSNQCAGMQEHKTDNGAPY